MIPEPPEFDEGYPERSTIARLLHRTRTMNRIHDALQSTLEENPLLEVVAATLVSRRGMGFSRALVFRYDPREGVFRPQAAYGAIDRETHDLIHADLHDEESMERAITEPESLELDWVDFESLLSESDEVEKEEGFWTRIAQRFRGENALLRCLQGASVDSQPALVSTDGLLGRLRRSKASAIVTHRDLANAELPSVLKEILPAESLWAMVRTRGAPRLLLVADKAFEAHPLDEVDQMHMDWFCGQAAFALERAELFSDLRRTNESLRGLDNLKSAFLSTISHELRSPLTAITGFARLLHNDQVGEVTPRQKEILVRVLSHGEKLTNIINDLIEIVEIDAGIAVNLNLTAVDPLSVMMESLPKVEPRRASKGAKIEPRCPNGAPLILADEKRLGRILHHLIDNAIKFGPDGGEVIVEFVPSEKEVGIKVIDQGIGISPEMLGKIFESFYQVDSQLARGYEGMGIGLTLIKKLVAGTGGRLEVESEYGKGTTFTISYPIYKG